MKTCIRCAVNKYDVEFYIRGGGIANNVCIDCSKLRANAHYANRLMLEDVRYSFQRWCITGGVFEKLYVRDNLV